MPETTKLFNCGDNKIKEIQYFPNHLEKARMECDIEVVSAIYSNKELLLKNVILLKRHFISWTLTGFAMKDRSENILLRIPLIMINIPIWLKVCNRW